MHCKQIQTYGSKKYDEDSLNEALELAGSMNADLGGNEIRKPLNAIYEQPAVEDKARVFSLGIGDAASQALVEGMAKAGGGPSAFVTFNERMDEKGEREGEDVSGSSREGERCREVGNG
ncbi:unnamed protein product [Orchesella dallaii]|uniref:Uncharacterized protein n=1 Tax=Orchesella dallaii TaxID=48710 RepID=A0ABP1QAD8_9HEXA